MTRWKSTLAERTEARRDSDARRAALATWLESHQCPESQAAQCGICFPANAARWAQRVARYEPRPKSRMQFTVESVRRSLSF